eukprot:CAMPEP_0184497160 /NCGR_PEP_ID=MMETSP0113_2-20130426/35829_1 /TAXON_ID=91329 /ORGANISM="Norrisiella sphaerica, Strain BC52" /LENGTH=1625 /DNA_ID=CAMNT_0026884143 /DNA_START=139 /DNA_END=5016 /DNA_ORIENTATION=-
MAIRNRLSSMFRRKRKDGDDDGSVSRSPPRGIVQARRRDAVSPVQKATSPASTPMWRQDGSMHTMPGIQAMNLNDFLNDSHPNDSRSAATDVSDLPSQMSEGAEQFEDIVKKGRRRWVGVKWRKPATIEELDAVFKDPENFGRYLGVVGAEEQQEVLFICEVEQLLEKTKQLDQKMIEAHEAKIAQMYLQADGGHYRINSITKRTRRKLQESIESKEGTDFEIWRKVQLEVKKRLCRESMPAFLEFIKREAKSVNDDEDYKYVFSIHDVFRNPSCACAFFLYMLKDRRHRLLLFWIDLTKERVVDLRKSLEADNKAGIPFELSLKLEEIYHKYVHTERGAPVVAEGETLDEVLDQRVVHRRLRAEEIRELGQELVGRLGSMFTKMDKIIRRECWPDFCTSDLYKGAVDRVYDESGEETRKISKGMHKKLKELTSEQDMYVAFCRDAEPASEDLSGTLLDYVCVLVSESSGNSSREPLSAKYVRRWPLKDRLGFPLPPPMHLSALCFHRGDPVHEMIKRLSKLEDDPRLYTSNVSTKLIFHSSKRASGVANSKEAGNSAQNGGSQQTTGNEEGQKLKHPPLELPRSWGFDEDIMRLVAGCVNRINPVDIGLARREEAQPQPLADAKGRRRWKKEDKKKNKSAAEAVSPDDTLNIEPEEPAVIPVVKGIKLFNFVLTVLGGKHLYAACLQVNPETQASGDTDTDARAYAMGSPKKPESAGSPVTPPQPPKNRPLPPTPKGIPQQQPLPPHNQRQHHQPNSLRSITSTKPNTQAQSLNDLRATSSLSSLPNPLALNPSPNAPPSPLRFSICVVSRQPLYTFLREALLPLHQAVRRARIEVAIERKNRHAGGEHVGKEACRAEQEAPRKDAENREKGVDPVLAKVVRSAEMARLVALLQARRMYRVDVNTTKSSTPSNAASVDQTASTPLVGQQKGDGTMEGPDADAENENGESKEGKKEAKNEEEKKTDSSEGGDNQAKAEKDETGTAEAAPEAQEIPAKAGEERNEERKEEEKEKNRLEDVDEKNNNKSTHVVEISLPSWENRGVNEGEDTEDEEEGKPNDGGAAKKAKRRKGMHQKLAAAIQTPDFTMSLLVRHLRPKRVLAAMEHLLMERKVVVLAHSASTLTSACAALRSLLFPFEWKYLFVPVMVPSMFQYLECPTPYLVGVSAEFRSEVLSIGSVETEALIVDLVNDQVFTKSTAALPVQFPVPVASYIEQHLRKLFEERSSTGVCDSDLLEDQSTGIENGETRQTQMEDHEGSVAVELQLALGKAWAHLLGGYRRFCCLWPEKDDPGVIFDAPTFLNTKPKHNVSFLNELFKTCAFRNFLEARAASDNPDGLRAVKTDLFDVLEEAESHRSFDSRTSISLDLHVIPRPRFSDLDVDVSDGKPDENGQPSLTVAAALPQHLSMPAPSHGAASASDAGFVTVDVDDAAGKKKEGKGTAPQSPNPNGGKRREDGKEEEENEFFEDAISITDSETDKVNSESGTMKELGAYYGLAQPQTTPSRPKKPKTQGISESKLPAPASPPNMALGSTSAILGSPEKVGGEDRDHVDGDEVTGTAPDDAGEKKMGASGENQHKKTESSEEFQDDLPSGTPAQMKEQKQQAMDDIEMIFKDDEDEGLDNQASV